MSRKTAVAELNRPMGSPFIRVWMRMVLFIVKASPLAMSTIVRNVTLLLGDETALYADAAYSSEEMWDTLKRFNIDDQVQRKGYRDHPISQADKDRNALIAVTRARSERPFATYKRLYGMARTRFMGLAKNTTAYGIAAMALNIRKGATFLRLYGLPDPGYTG